MLLISISELLQQALNGENSTFSSQRLEACKDMRKNNDHDKKEVAL